MKITIKKEALEYALLLLDFQCEYVKSYDTKIQKEKQLSYYQGMHTMLNALVQQGFTDDSLFLWTDQNNKHSIKHKGEIK